VSCVSSNIVNVDKYKRIEVFVVCKEAVRCILQAIVWILWKAFW